MSSKEITSVEEERKKVTANLEKVLQNRNDDYDYGRDVLYMAAESLIDILESAKVLAQESEHPRAIEVATNTANSLADIAGKMMDHHVKTKKVNEAHNQAQEVNKTTNNLNINVKTSELLDLLTKD
jgi:hypothetical protein